MVGTIDNCTLSLISIIEIMCSPAYINNVHRLVFVYNYVICNYWKLNGLMNRNLSLPFGLSLFHDPTKLLPSIIGREKFMNCDEICIIFLRNWYTDMYLTYILKYLEKYHTYPRLSSFAISHPCRNKRVFFILALGYCISMFYHFSILLYRSVRFSMCRFHFP